MQPAGRPQPWDRRRLAVLVAGAYFMEFLDGTILSTAAPDIARSLAVTPGEIGLAITAYLVTLAVLIPISGWLAERFGSRTVFLTAIALFTVSSGLCAASTSLGALVALRVLQGAGGAMMVPVGRLVVLRGTAKSDLVRAIAFLTWPALVAPIVAPLLGGLLTTYLSWRWIFLVNIPLGVVGFVLALRLFPQSREVIPSRLDWGGFVLTAVSLTSLVVMTSALGSGTVNWGLVVASSVVGIAAGAAAIRHLARCNQPLLDLAVLRVRTFRISHYSGSVFRATVFALPFVLPLMFQEGLGWSPVKAGAVVMAVFVGNIVIKPATTGILDRWPFRSVIIASVIVVSATMAGCALVGPGTPLGALVALLVVSGAARSVGFTAYATLAFADIHDRELTHANSLSATIQQLAGGFGVALGVVGIKAGAALDLGGSSVSPYRLTLLLLSVLTLTTIVEAVRLGGAAGDQLRRA